MALEDYTTYTEVDLPGHINVVDGQHLNCDNLERNDVSYIYKDFGVGGIGTTFIHCFESDWDGGDDYCYGGIWAITNDNTKITGNYMNGQNEGINVYHQLVAAGTQYRTQLREYDGNSTDTYTTGGYHGHNYYTCERNGATYTLKIYDDAPKTILLDTLTVNGPAATTYRYLAAAHSLDSANYGSAKIQLQVYNHNLSCGNTAPSTPSDENPINNATCINIDESGGGTTLSVNVHDPDGDNLDVSFYMDLQDGNGFVGIANYANQPSGTTVSHPISSLSCATSYKWYVEVDDGTETTSSPTFTFTVNCKPVNPGSTTPNDGATGVGGGTVQLKVNVSDPDGDTMTVKFYNADGDILLDTVSGVPDMGNATYDWTGINCGGIVYQWYVTIEDSCGTLKQSPTYTFTTEQCFQWKFPLRDKVEKRWKYSVKNTQRDKYRSKKGKDYKYKVKNKQE